MFKWLFTKEYLDNKAKQKANKPSFWQSVLNALTYNGSSTIHVNQSSTGKNSGNYHSSSINTIGNNNVVVSQVNGKTKVIVNGKQVLPGSPEYKRAMHGVHIDHVNFKRDMDSFKKDMEEMANDMKGMFK